MSTEVPAIAAGFPVYVSSIYSQHLGVEKIRLNEVNYDHTTAGQDAWVSSTTDTSPYVVVNLGVPRTVVAIATQGRGDASQYVTQYTVEYSPDGANWFFVDSARVFAGNADSTTIVKNYFLAPETALAVRVNPVNYVYEVALRLEVYYLSS